MKAKHKRPDRRVLVAGATEVRSSTEKRALWSRYGVALIVGACAVLAAIWFGIRSWRPSGAPIMGQSTENSIRGGSGAAPVRLPAKARNEESQEAVVSKINRANELLTQGKPAEAVQVLTEAMQLSPNDEDVHYNLGLAYTRLGKLDEAIRQYNEALRIFPNYAEAHNNLGNVLMRAGRTEEATAQFESAVKVMPDYASAHNNLGTALQRAGRTNEALLQFQQAAKLMPEYWEAHFNVATSCLQAGKLDEARTELQTVLRLRPDFEPAKAALAEVEGQRASGAEP